MRLRHYLAPLLGLLLAAFGDAFHMHKIMAAALLANSLQRNAFLPLPIPIPIPIKVGGNTIIAMPTNDGGTTYIPIQRTANQESYSSPLLQKVGYRAFW
ncbi:hypothetical protein JTE90_017241 [Oedothorax gibbosus]|uniref:Uncharacterized protein n=1 Tax=Oedothorax gibbosus TaxID=931172 RepID=A0AAV6VDW2_9ARAC|nr:hypothetical protein JTE90_017241 [Oedothorax gibbosus]